MAHRQHKSLRAVKLLISMGFFGVAYLWSLFRCLTGKRLRSKGVILYYHAIPPEQRSLFAKQMDLLIRLTKPVTIDWDSSLDPGVRYSAVTFDDGLQSVLENALPELRKRNIPTTLFVTTGSLGQYPDWWPQSAHDGRHERIVSAEQLQQLPADLISIGSHTITHPMLPSLSEEEARRELYVSRMNLEQLLERRITLFSFPFGSFNRRLVDWCRDAGYERVFTTLPEDAFGKPAGFVAGRVLADPTDSLLEFRLKLLGAYRWLPCAFTFKRWILSNVLVSTLRFRLVHSR